MTTRIVGHGYTVMKSVAGPWPSSKRRCVGLEVEVGWGGSESGFEREEGEGVVFG